MVHKLKLIGSHFIKDSLYRNSLYIMTGSFVTAIFGFLFWVVNTKLFTTEEVGLATAIISSTVLINNFSLFGMNAGLVRYMSRYKDKSILINTSYIIVGIGSLILSSLYVILIDFTAPKLSFLKDNIVIAIYFIILTSLSAIYIINNSVFTSLRSAKYILIYNIINGLTKVSLPLIFISFGALGIYYSYSLGIFISLFFIVLVLASKFEYKPKLEISFKSLNDIKKFATYNYIINFIGGLPSTLFPVIILNSLGPKLSAYYYIDMMIIGFLYMIPIAISQSFFAESSYDISQLKINIKKSIKLNSLILLPAILLTIILGKYVLLFFGQDYSTEGYTFLWIMSLSAIFVPINYIYGIYLMLIKRIEVMTAIILISMIITISIAYVFTHQGLIGIAYGLIGGQLTQVILYYLYTKFKKK